MSANKLELGDIITELFPVHNPQNREQEGYRPAIVVGLPENVGVPCYDMVIVVPITTHHNQVWANIAPHLYPRLKAGVGNLPHDSIVLTDQVRSRHTSRMVRYIGQLLKAEFRPISRALAHMGS